jgi:hypothetical protein
MLHPKYEQQQHNITTKWIKHIEIFITGDTKWFCMLLCMEDMAPHYCVYCLLSSCEWNEINHDKGESCTRTITYMNETVDKFYITETTKSDPKLKGVKSKPFWSFIPVSHYCLSILHIQLGIFNDIDSWFMDRVAEIVESSPREQELRSKIVHLEKHWRILINRTAQRGARNF